MTEKRTSTTKSRFEWVKNYNLKRAENSTKHKKLNIILMVLFPIFITCMAEINQFKHISSFCEFVAERPSVLLFDIFIAEIVYIFLISAFRKGWIATVIQGLTYMILSITELFKYNTNGNHLILADIKLLNSTKVKSLKSFAYIKITPQLIIYCLIVLAVIALIFHFNPILPKRKPFARATAAAACTTFSMCMIVFPAFYNSVYSLFKIDTTASSNAFLLNEKFNNNSFLAFIVQTSSESFANRLVEPDNYSEKYVDKITDINYSNEGNFNNGTKPNVIVIMSESYGDFRAFDELDIDDSYYAGFDKACNEGISGTIITPTYASWTVRSEFELIFGLPVRGINTPNMPQNELAEREQPTIAQYYKNWGYTTAYVHPFQSSFYSRDQIYSNFGFDLMLFHDDIENTSDFTVEVNHYGTYVDDATTFNQLLDLVETTDNPIYIHTTTMQNHQPYDQGENPDDEMGNYLQWIQHTNEGLTDFLDELKEIDEPTLVFFVGDHFPSMRGETSVYNQLNITGANCSKLYEQKYFLWSNYDADFSTVPQEKFSFFYVPYVIADVINAPHDSFIEKMDSFMEKIPVYTSDYNDGTPDNEELDVLTYDRVIGEVMSPCPIPDEVLEASKGD